MNNFLVYFLVLGIVSMTKCGLNLQITKNSEDFLSPVSTSGTVEERVGTTFSLICELLTSGNHSDLVDENLEWVKGENLSNDSRFMSIVSSKNVPSRLAINKCETKFEPLRLDDKGNYYCMSRKFNLYKNVQVLVRDNTRNEQRPMRETTFCTDQMFQCMSNGVCIIPHYVCDGKPDCNDGSDETVEKCNGDPCRDKIPCDDGRCIPTAWCCDRHHDMNCTVTNRPKCCQVLSESYEELEYGVPNISSNPAQHNGARYLFISVCIVSILFSIVLLLLIVSKVVIFAKKTALQQQRHNLCDDIALRNQTNVNIIRTNFNPNNVYTVRHNTRTPRNNIIIDASDVNDPLLFNSTRFNVVNAGGFNDQPPSYVDVLRNTRLISEPPPPYTSREILNCYEERQERA